MMGMLPPGYVPGRPHVNALGYPVDPMMMPPSGYGMPPGHPMMSGWTMPAGYPGMPPAYAMPPVAAPVTPAVVAVGIPVAEAVPLAAPAPEPASSAPPEVSVPSETPMPPPVASQSQAPFSRPPNRLIRMWRNAGGGSLTLSIVIHAAILVAAGLFVLTTAVQDKNTDFLPGGGTRQGAEASAALSHQIQQRRQQRLQKSMPRQRLVTSSMNATLSLPEQAPDLIDIPDRASLLGGGGKLGGGGGFGTGGAGGGFGNGLGKGGLGGITFKPLMMFGLQLKDTRKIAVVMDVSRSMTRYLPIVAKELDKVARGSPLVLYFGCGLKKPPRGLDDKVRKVADERFDKFWYFWEGAHDMGELRKDYDKLKVPGGEPMPLAAVYNQMKKRPNTYFIDFNGIIYTSPALICKEVMEADTIYWFSDFQDAVDAEHARDVMKKLRGRKQKLYMHASVRGSSFEVVRDELCTPLGGEVLETKVD